MIRQEAMFSARRNPLWTAYASTTASPDNAGFMAWVSEQAAAFRKVHRMGRFDRLPREAWVRWCESTPTQRSQP